jgi:hypothetical protein
MRKSNSILILFFVLFLPLFARDIEKFNPEKEKDLLDLISTQQKNQLISALQDAAGNYKELTDAIRKVDKEKKGDLVWLILNMPHLDRLAITSQTLLEHIDYAYNTRKAFKYEVPKDLFKEFILTYRISEEPVSSYRKILFEKFLPLVKNENNPSDAAKIVNEWVGNNITLREKEFFGEVLPPVLILKGKKGTEEEISILTTAILKSIGIPSRRAKVRYFGEQKGGASWVEVYAKGRWLPLYPLNPESFGDFHKYEKEKPLNITLVSTTSAFKKDLVTENYTQVGKLKLYLTWREKPAIAFRHFSVNVFNDGCLSPLDDLSFGCRDEECATDSAGFFEAALGDGIYYVETGVRDSTGNVFVNIQKIEMKPQETLELKMEIAPED